MRTGTLALMLGLAFALSEAALAPQVASAGVPRSCVHPQADALACPRDTRSVTHRVLPARRVRALRAQQRAYERASRRDAVRMNDFTLRELRDELRCERCRDR